LGTAFVRRPYLTTLLLSLVFASPGLHLGLSVAATPPGDAWRAAYITAFWVVIGLYVAIMAALSYGGAGMRKALGAALVAAAIVSVTALTGLGLLGEVGFDRSGHLAAIFLLVLTSYAILMAAVFSFFAAMGRYAKSLRKLKEERDADRQSLLQRVFELHGRLEGVDQDGRAQEPEDTASEGGDVFGLSGGLMLRDSKLVRWVQRFIEPTTLFFVFSVNAAVVSLQKLVLGGGREAEDPAALAVQFVGQFVTVLVFVALFQMGALAGSIRRAVWVLVSATAAMALASIYLYLVWPEQLLGQADAMGIQAWGLVLISLAINSFIFLFPVGAGAMAGAYGKLVEKERRIAANDRVAIEEEISRLQSRLTREVRQAHFMCTDIVGSTRLKDGADPLAVEYTFIEYHRYIASKVFEQSGAIHSTSGDGVVATFPDAQRALSAGLAIQRGLDRFNVARNTLGQPIRLRVGIHSGPVAGEGYTVAFSQALDVAAHVERVCPPGALAITHDALARTGSPPAGKEHPERVDGHRVAIVAPQSSASPPPA
jgi:class 3 adenylate cyclase